MNIKKLTTLAAVGIVSLLSTFQTPTKTDAALTAPSSYDYSFVYNSNISAFNYTTSGTSPTSIALFNRTTDGAYYNYSHTFSNSGSHTNTTNFDLPDGLDITMTFNRSNTSWTNASPSYTGYYPTDTKIGSDNTVGSTTNKMYLKFDNQTNNDYNIYIDLSSSINNVSYQLKINNDWYITNNVGNTFTITSVSDYIKIFLPSKTYIEFNRSSTSVAHYLDAWYLQDLGVSDAYNAGYDQGEIDGYGAGYSDGLNNNPNILLNGFQAMVGILVNFFLMIVNLEVFGVSITGIFAIIVIFVGIVWVLKLIRG